jgi:hypothetical protein
VEVIEMKRSLLIAFGLALLASTASTQYQYSYINITMPRRAAGLNPSFVPPIMTYEWESMGYPPFVPHPAEVRWILEPRADHGNSFVATINYIRNTPDAPGWFPWQTIDPPDVGTSWTTPPVEYGYYVFAIHARDSTGNTNWIFDEAYNLRRVSVSAWTTGPLLTVTGDHIDPIQTVVTTTPPTQIELTYGTPVSFCWKADACAYGGMTEAYRYGWDITDPDDPSQWDIPWTPISDGEEACSPVVVYDSGVHTFYVEVVDSYGHGARIPIEITYVQIPPPPGGSVGIFTDAGGADCNAYDIAPAMLIFYVVHVRHVGATEAYFSAPQPTCFSTAVHLADTPVFPITVGNSQTGVRVSYGSCRSAPVHVLTIAYFVQGLTQSCCYYPILPHPGIGEILVNGCGGTGGHVATGGEAIINPTAHCMCDTPVKDITWGGIKALYQ